MSNSFYLTWNQKKMYICDYDIIDGLLHPWSSLKINGLNGSNEWLVKHRGRDKLSVIILNNRWSFWKRHHYYYSHHFHICFFFLMGATRCSLFYGLRMYLLKPRPKWSNEIIIYLSTYSSTGFPDPSRIDRTSFLVFNLWCSQIF